MGIVLVLTLAFVVIEIAAGVHTHSLAVVTDAAHNIADCAGITFALVATMIGQRTRRGLGNSDTMHRTEVISALVTSVLLLVVALTVLNEALHRLRVPHMVEAPTIVVVGAVGLIINLLAFEVARRGDTSHVVMRGVYLEVLADALGSVGVLVAGVFTGAFGWNRTDAVVTICIALFMVPRSLKLGRDSLRLLKP